MLNVIIPMAGIQTTADTDYIQSLQEIEQKTVLQYVIESLEHIRTEHFLTIIRREDARRYHLDSIVRLLRPDAEIVTAEEETMGAACTCLLAIDYIDLEAPLLITGSNQTLSLPMEDIISSFQREGYDAGVVIFEDVHPRWSFVRLDEDRMVVEAAEKRPISKHATAGIYYFKKARFFVEAAERMIEKRASVNGRFYVCPALNEMILRQQTIGVYEIDRSQYFRLDDDAGIHVYRDFLKEKRL